MIQVENFINGEFVSCHGYMDSYNPGTGKVHAKIPDSNAKDVEKAVAAAEKAFPM